MVRDHHKNIFNIKFVKLVIVEELCTHVIIFSYLCKDILVYKYV